MIIPMYKYSFLVYHENYSGFLSDLKELGVVHIIEKKDEPTEKMQEEFRQVNEIEKLIKFLEKRDVTDVTAKVDIPSDGEKLVADIRDIQHKLEQLHQHLGNRKKELLQLEPWGQFSWDDMGKLKEAGIKPVFYYIPNRKFDAGWEKEYNIGVVSTDDRYTYFVLFLEDGEEISELHGAEEVRLPDKTLDEVKQEISSAEKEIKELNAKLDAYAKYGVEALKKYKNEIQDRLNMESALHHTDDQVEGKVKLLEGWTPETNIQDLENYLEEKNILYLKSEPHIDERPPIKLKNGPFARLFEPIGKLFSLPSYIELDLTPFFAPFFMMFFGFCLGDAGYGLIFVIAATIYKYKVPKEYKPLLSMVQWLGSATVLFGALTGTFFGINLAEQVDAPFLQDVKKMFLTPEDMFNLALVFGFIQIVFGMFIKVANQIKQHGIGFALSTIGWIIVILSTATMAVLDMVNGATEGNKMMFSTIHLVILGIAGLGIYVFNHPKRNVFVNIGAGLWDTYNMVTGFAGDLLSYIRLFALGLSSAILGMVFNQLATELSPDVIVVKQLVFVIILLFGHGLNIFMSGLGSFVHPMRLTFVEFYKNAGFIGGGKEYKPFRKLN
ncbi:MAG: V-type ATP synthase subunit I [Chlorobi bacterium]|nr:V-type ATP synthase subunit I [Chlorobiota bacterium]